MSLKDQILSDTKRLLQNPSKELKELEKRFVSNGKLDTKALSEWYKEKAQTKEARSYSDDPQTAKRMHRDYLKEHPGSNLRPEDFYREPEKKSSLPEIPQGKFDKITKSFDKKLEGLSKTTGLSKKQIGAIAGGTLATLALPLFITGAPIVALAGSWAAYHVGQKAGEKAVDSISSKQAGALKVPPRMLSEICNWIFRCFAQHHLSRQREYLGHINRAFANSGDQNKRDRSLVELQLMMRFFRQFCNATTPPDVSKISNRFDLNIDGWSYHNDLEDCQGCFPDGLLVELYHPIRWMDELYEEGYNSPMSMLGEYKANDQKIRIVIPIGILRSRSQAKSKMKEIARTVRHEMQHFTQHLMRLLSKGRGQPKAKITRGGPWISYPLKDNEYKPLLEDEVYEFISRMNNLNVDITPDVLRFLVRQWTGAISGSKIRRVFFETLKSKDPVRYQQACKEFYQMVTRYLVQNPHG